MFFRGNMIAGLHRSEGLQLCIANFCRMEHFIMQYGERLGCHERLCPI